MLVELHGTSWLVVALLYGGGLRLMECLELRVKNVDLERRHIVLRRAKGQKEWPRSGASAMRMSPRRWSTRT